MGFRITTPTSIPLNADGTHDSPTWGESGGPYTVPPNEDTGLGSVALASNDVNYEWQHQSRWSRAQRDRSVFSDEGLFTSCVVSQGAWNDNAGTLNITLAPTRMVIDVDGNGGTVIEVVVPLGDPLVLAPNTDNYVDFDESGNVSVQSVANGNPSPAVPAGYVRVYVLTTDGTQLTSADAQVAAFPVLGPIVGAQDLYSQSIITSSLLVTGLSTLSDDVTCSNEITVLGPATFGLDVTVSGPLTVTGATNLRGPAYISTHATTSTWADGYRPTWRTFTSSGVVAPGGQLIYTPITAASGSALLFSINDLTPTTNSAFVAFDVDLQIVWANGGSAPTAAAGLKTYVKWSAVATCNAGTWGATTNGTQTIVGAALGGSAVSLQLSSGQIAIAVTHDLGVENRGYRQTATVRAHVMELA